MLMISMATITAVLHPTQLTPSTPTTRAPRVLITQRVEDPDERLGRTHSSLGRSSRLDEDDVRSQALPGRPTGLDIGPWSMVYAPGMSATISQVASEVGVGPDTIRYYERVGLLPSPHRSANGYRSYGAEDVERLRFIRGAQRLGLRLRDIRELLAIRDKGLCPCGHTATLVTQRLTDLDAQILNLKRLRREMARLLESLPSDTVGEDEPWPCNVQFIRAGGGEADG